jgi:energy-coupling factor transport system substrate-specific component
VLGVVAFGGFEVLAPNPDTGVNVPGANAYALILALALVVGFAVYAALEYAQTRRLASITSQFDTRTLVLMPVAIAFNIILGQAVAAALKIPIYLDSIGTILVGALAGPIAGALTGLLSNLLWSYVLPPPFHNDASGAFAIVAVVIGILAGVFARRGWLRPRPNQNMGQLAIGAIVAVGLILVLSWLAYLGYGAILGSPDLAPGGDDFVFQLLGWVALGLVAGTVIGLVVLLFVRRDLTAAYVVVAGVITGLIAGAISAPISANVFGGVTGAGTDFIVAAFRYAGADIQAATLGQSLISDPIDKVVTFFVVYLILGALATRTKARFPQGEKLVAPEEAI